MKSRRLLGLLAVALATTVSMPAHAAPQRAPFLPMALITVTRTADAATPDVFIGFPAEWTCWQDFSDPRAIDISCLPPAAPAGAQNWCAWVAAASQSDNGQQAAPSTTSFCGNAAATAGRESAAAATFANTQLQALRCRIVLTVNPPNAAFRASCTTNH